MIKPFTKNVTTADLLDNYKDGTLRFSVDLIRHMETQFEALQKEIDLLKGEENKLKSGSQFKVGWVYDDKRGDIWLVLNNIDDGNKKFPIDLWKLSAGVPKQKSFTKEGFEYHPIEFSDNHLIPESGRKWEIED